MPVPLTLLLVDDSETDRTIYRRFLGQDDRYSYQIIEFDQGEEALHWCQTHRADVILLDYQLPDLDGLEFLQALRQQSREAILPVAMLTAYGDTALVVEAMGQGIQTYLDKNQMTPEGLRQCVHRVLEQTQLKQQLGWQQEQQRLVATTALRIRQSLKLDKILKTAVQEIRSLLQTDRVLVYQFNPDWNGQVVVESVGEGWCQILGEIIDDPCFRTQWHEPYRQSRFSKIENIHTAAIQDCYRQMLLRFQVQANLVMPLLEGEQLWGLLIAHQCSGPRTWQEREIELLQQLSVQLAIAIGQAELHEQLQQELVQRQQTEIRFQAIFEQSPEGKVRFAPDGSVIAVNRAWEELWQTTAATLAGYNILEDPAVDVQGHRAGIRAAFAGETVRFPPFFRDPAQSNRPGRARWIDMLMYPIKSLEGQVLEVMTVTRDITDRIAAEQEQQRLIRLIENSSNFIGTATLDGQVTFVNPAGQALVGLEADRVTQTTIWEYQTPEENQRLQTMVIPAVLSTGSWLGEFEMRHFQTGELIPVECNIFTLKNAQTGEPEGIATVTRDLRERKQAERSLRENEEKLRLLIKYAPAGIAMFDREMRYIMASQRWVEDFSLDSVESLIHRSHYEVFPEIPERWRQVHQRCLAGAIEQCDSDLFVRSDGSQQWLRWAVHPWYTADAQIGGIIIFVEEISDLKRSEISLQQSEARLRLAQTASHSAAWDWDITTNHLTWSPEYYQLYRLDPSVAATYESWLQCIHPDDRVRVSQQTLQALESGPSEVRIDFRVMRSGEIRWFAGIGQVLYNPIGKPIRMIGLTIDITEQKQAEIALQELNTTLEQRIVKRTAEIQASNKELEDFAFIASHDLKEPLRTVRNFSTLLQMTCGESLDERGKDYLNRIDKATQRMQTLINDLLRLSRVATVTSPFGAVDLNQVMAQVIADLQGQIQQTGGQVQVAKLPTIEGDRGQLLQLFQNLVSNALKFHGAKSPVVKVYADTNLPPQNGGSYGNPQGYRLCVEDNGIGFEPKYRDRIFGAFERLHGRDRYEGTGIGLAICKKIVERHDGTIEAHSTPGQGATFILTLPQ